MPFLKSLLKLILWIVYLGWGWFIIAPTMWAVLMVNHGFIIGTIITGGVMYGIGWLLTKL